MGGRPRIKGTRSRAGLMLRRLAFPGLTAAGRGGLGMPTHRVSSAPRQRDPEAGASPHR